MTPEERIAAIRADLEAARQELYGLCDGSRKFTMCVPVRPADTDEVMARAFDGTEWLLAENQRLRAVADAARGMPEPTAQGTGDMHGYRVCLECRAKVRWHDWQALQHAPDCPWLLLQATLRALDGGAE